MTIFVICVGSSLLSKATDVTVRPSPTREKCFGVHTLGSSLNRQIFPEMETLSKNVILLVLLGKL